MTETIDNNLEIIAESAKQFAETHIRPYMMDWDETQHFPTDLFPKLGEMVRTLRDLESRLKSLEESTPQNEQ